MKISSRQFLWGGVAVLIVLFALWYFFWNGAVSSLIGEEPIACTMEAKICPDGSAVGRTGPKCEFAQCLNTSDSGGSSSGTPVTGNNGSNIGTANIGRTVVVQGIGITPTQVMSDNRCPVDVTCIVAGEVKVKTVIGYGSTKIEKVLTSNVPTEIAEGLSIEITNVLPVHNSKTIIKAENYLFTFKVIGKAPQATSASRMYSNSQAKISVRLPDDYTVDENYSYQGLGPNKAIKGIKFTIPRAVTVGTNLSTDSYISVEQIASVPTCTANSFLSDGASFKTVRENDKSYSVGTLSGAGAGNRYEETVYAFSGTNSCVGVRYYIHSTVLENYPSGTVKAFDKTALLAAFDQIRRSLVVNQ